MNAFPVSLLLLMASGTAAFDAAEDSAGFLRARIEGPAVIADAGKPFPIAVVIVNAGETAASGTVRLEVVDRWGVEPSSAAPFTVSGSTAGSTAGSATARLEFRASAGAGTPPAHYPIHARIEFESGGARLSAHPVLIVDARLEAPPRPSPDIEWIPYEVPADAALALWQLPVRRVVIQVAGEEPRALPPGWEGSDPGTRAEARSGTCPLRGDARQGIAIHPPWSGGRRGAAWVEFPLKLPASCPVRLRFLEAIREHREAEGEPPSDGVTFRVRVLPLEAAAGAAGEAVFERHSVSKIWREAVVDLDRFAGKAIRLQLESHPGPKNDTTCDLSWWAEPTLIAGSPPAAGTPFPPPGGATPRALGTIGSAGDRYEVLLWSGRRGLLDAVLGFRREKGSLLFHGLTARVLGYDLEDPRSPAALIEAREEKVEGGIRFRHRFRSPEGPFDLIGELRLDPRALRAGIRLENAPAPRPWRAAMIEGAGAGAWSERASRVYAGPGNVIQDPEAFQLGFDGHRLSTSFAGFDFPGGISMVQAVDAPPDRLEVDPGRCRYTLVSPHAQTLTFIPARDVWKAAGMWREINGLKAAPGVEKLAGRFVFDLWGGRYGESTRALARSFHYGLTDAVVIWHNWQRWGYDYRLPDIYPPNPALGTLEEFRALARSCADRGVLFAPHDNYIDFYPDAEGFSCDLLAFNRDGLPVRAWFNRGRGAQSYRFRPDVLRPYVERNLHLIRSGFAPTAYFIDVWSSIQPYDCWTADGKFLDRLSTRDAWGGHFDWIRDFLGGAPQISESGHDQLIGHLDGAQANHLRVGKSPPGEYSWAVWPIRCADAERVPWFDAAHHDRFVLHGAGYDPRYRGGLDADSHGIHSDDYIATEVLTGHPAMVPSPFGRAVVRKYWLLHDAMRALALRRLESVEFDGGDIHRQRVRWEGGGEVWVNRGESDWKAAERVLPPFGFYARIPEPGGIVEAAIERRGGETVEWSRSAQSLYVNARASGETVSFGELATGGALRIELAGEALRIIPLPGGPRFRVSWQWKDLPWQIDEHAAAEVLDEEGNAVRSLPLEAEDGGAALECEPGVFGYRIEVKTAAEAGGRRRNPGGP